MKQGGVLDRLGYKGWKCKPRWEGGGAGRVLRAKIRGGVLGVRGNRYRVARRAGEIELETGCPVCGIGEETEEHWLWECVNRDYAQERSNLGKAGGYIGDWERIVGWGEETEGETRAVETFLRDMWTARSRSCKGGGGQG